jgi:hypothetical protein
MKIINIGVDIESQRANAQYQPALKPQPSVQETQIEENSTEEVDEESTEEVEQTQQKRGRKAKNWHQDNV